MIRTLAIIYVTISLVILIGVRIKRDSITDVVNVMNKIYLATGRTDKIIPDTFLGAMGVTAIIPLFRWYVAIIVVGVTVNKHGVIISMIANLEDGDKK